MADLVVAVPRVVLAALRVERAREEGLTAMPLLDLVGVRARGRARARARVRVRW